METRIPLDELGKLQTAVVKYIDDGNSWKRLAEDIGIMEKRGGTKVKRKLGLLQYSKEGKYGPYTCLTISDDVAGKITRAIGLAPVDVGL